MLCISEAVGGWHEEGVSTRRGGVSASSAFRRLALCSSSAATPPPPSPSSPSPAASLFWDWGLRFRV